MSLTDEYGGTRFAIFRSTKASPMSRPMILHGSTLESAHEMIMNYQSNKQKFSNFGAFFE